MKLEEMMNISLKLCGRAEMPEDSGVVYDSGKEIKRVLAGIDMGAAEMNIAHELGFDCVASHHPHGIWNPAMADLLVRDHFEKMLECGVPINTADKISRARRSGMAQRTHSQNLDVHRSLARLLDISFAALHTPADILAEKYVQKRMDALSKKDPLCRLRDVTKELMKIREYKEAFPGQQPEIWVGEPDSYAGRIYVEMYGVGAPDISEYNACTDAGVGTFVCMHATPDVLEGFKARGRANIIVAGHMASDSLGFNQILSAWEKQGVEVVRVSGII